MTALLERWFRLSAAGTTIRREIVAGATTFVTLSYILFVQPVVLGACGMDPGGVLFATCVASAAACFLMAWWANYPVALAPGMGSNFFFAYTVCLGMGFTWQQALAANAISGAVCLVLVLSRFREQVLAALPLSLRLAIAAGIGLLIAIVGFRWGGLLAPHPVTYVQLGNLRSPVALLALGGLALSAILWTRGVPGAILLGILASAAAGVLATRALGLDPPLAGLHGIAGPPPSPAGTAFALDFAGLFARPAAEWGEVLLVLLVLDLFDPVGTLVGLGQKARLLDAAGNLPRAKGAFAADAVGTVLGAVLGTSTITSYAESAAGISAGGRTGLTAVVTGILLLLALVFTPLFASIGGGVPAGSEVFYPVLAPVLILIGAMMLGPVRHLEWDDPFEAVPAFLAILVMPLSLSITDGLAFGVIASSLLALAGGRPRRAPLLLHGLAALFVARYAWL